MVYSACIQYTISEGLIVGVAQRKVEQEYLPKKSRKKPGTTLVHTSKSTNKAVLANLVKANAGDIDAEADSKGLLLSKSFDYIHISNSISLVQRKMVNILLHNAYPNLLTAERHRIPWSQLLDMLGVERNNLPYIKAAFRSLMDIKLEWSVFDSENREDWTTATAIASANIKGEYAYYSYAPEVSKKLFDPRISAIINLLVQNLFNSAYALSLYENALRYRDDPEFKEKDGSPVWIPLDIFKILLGATSKAYEEFKEFNRAVLTPAIEEVNKVSNIRVKPEFKREKRKVVAIRFEVTSSSQALLDLRGGDNSTTVYSFELFKRIRDFGIGESQAKALAIEFDEERINRALDYVEQRVQAGKVKAEAAAGYAVRAIQGGWAKEESKFEREKRAQQEQQESTQRSIEEAEKRMSSIRKAFTAHRENKIQEIINGMSQKDMEELKNEFIANLNQVEIGLLRKNGFDESTLLQAKFKRTVAEKFLREPEDRELDAFQEKFFAKEAACVS